MTHLSARHRTLPLASCLLAGLALLFSDVGYAQMKQDVQKPAKTPTVRGSSGGSGGRRAAPPASPKAAPPRSRSAAAPQQRGRAPQRIEGQGHPGRDRRPSNPADSYNSGATTGHRSGGGDRAYGDRGRRDSYRHDSGHRHYRGCGHYYNYGHYAPYGSLYWGIGYGSPYYWGYYGYGAWPYSDTYRYRPDYSRSGRAYGALDLDVKPENAEIYVDGRFVGIADNFDGFPSYLWLEEGSYEISLYLSGFQTVTRQLSVTPEAIVDIDDRLVPGDSIKPVAAALPAESAGDQEWARKEDEWRDRARDYKARKRAEAEPGVGSLDVRGEPGRVHLSIAPGDASVYLDGRLLGSAADLTRLHAGLIVNPGRHELQVVHPDYESSNVAFSVDSGKDEKVEVHLERGPGAV
jgi:hypothetical protein